MSGEVKARSIVNPDVGRRTHPTQMLTCGRFRERGRDDAEVMLGILYTGTNSVDVHNVLGLPALYRPEVTGLVLRVDGEIISVKPGSWVLANAADWPTVRSPIELGGYELVERLGTS
jgi:hypothetical protein